MHKLNQKGVIHLLIPIILLLGLVAGVYLITSGNPLKLFSKAGGGWLVVKDQNGVPYPQVNGVTKIKSPTVWLEFYAPWGLKPAVSGPITVYTLSYKIAKNPTDLINTKAVLMTKDPTTVIYTFKDSSAGSKFIWAEFLASDGRTERRSAQIEIIAVCQQRPACLDGRPACKMAEPVGGWCPTPVPSGILCNDNEVSLQVSPSLLVPGQAAKFTISGDASTYINDQFSGPGNINCNIGAWNNRTCSVDKAGDYTWTHTWKHCVGDFNHCSVQCSKTTSFAVRSGPTPTLIPAPAAKRVFVTSTTYNGNLGGLSGADAKCQTRANVAKLGGTWKAWLSDSTTSVVNRFIKNTSGYQLINGTKIANDWKDLTDGSLQNKININEYGKVNGSADLVWTNTNYNGLVLNNNVKNCSNWNTSSSSVVGIMGNSGFTNSNWTYNTAGACSISNALLYCFEQ